MFLVRETGLEPAHLAILAPKASASTNSATRACGVIISENYRYKKVKLFCLKPAGYVIFNGKRFVIKAEVKLI